MPTEDPTGAVQEQSILEDPNEFIRRRAQKSQLCPSTFLKILQKDLNLRAYKIHHVQELKPNQHQVLCWFGEWPQKELTTIRDFYQ